MRASSPRSWVLAVPLCLGLVGCFNSRSDRGASDAGGGDPGPSPDGGVDDASVEDGGVDPGDPDAGGLTVESVCASLCTALLGCGGGGDQEECESDCGYDVNGCPEEDLEWLDGCPEASCDDVWDCIVSTPCLGGGGEPYCGDGTCDLGECAECAEDCPDGCVCPHDVCGAGVALDPGCGTCEAIACAEDAYCCEVAWDDTCIAIAAQCGSCGCGDGVCDAGECASCAEDCPVGCGTCSDGSPAFGSDAFGYLGCLGELDGTPPCEDISTTGTLACSDDDCVTTVALPFAFDFYGVAHTSVDLGSNGLLGFPASGDFENSCTIEADTIAVYWDDLDPSSGGAVRYQAFGTAPDRHMTFQWKVPHFGGGTLHDIRAVLREGSSDIEICYVDTATLGVLTDSGASATVGIADPGGDALLYSCGAPKATSDLLVRFEHPPDSGGGLFSPRVTYEAPLNGDGLAIDDLDGDAILDVVLSTSLGVSVFLGNGDGTLQPQVSYDAGTDTKQAMAIADLDGDGATDVVVTGQGSATPVGVLLGNGDGTFAAPVKYPASGTVSFGVAIGDLDGDAAPDLVVTNFFANSVSVLLGDGDGTFASPVQYATNTNPFAVAIGDLDGDGHLDVVVDTYSGTVSILLGNGDGTLQARSDVAIGNPGGIAIGDVDGDDVLDLVATNCCGETTVSVLLGDGDGTFQAAQTYEAGVGPMDLAIGDLDGDGMPDLVVTDNNNDEVGLNVAILIGNGDGSFQAPLFYQAGRTPMEVAIGDLDGDGAPDFAVASNQSEEEAVSVFINAQ